MPAAIAIPAIIGAAGSIGGAALAAHGAGQQADAAMSAAQLQHQDAQAALQFNNKVFDTQQANAQPWLKAGQGAVTSLSGMLNQGAFPDWQGNFQAPTGVTEQNDPGFQFRLQEGLKALQNSAAAKGDLLSGGTLKGLNNYAQNEASNEYGNVYNRSFGQYLQKYNEFQNNQSNRFNRYAALAGVGQTAAGQIGQAGQNAAGNNAQILLNSGQQIGQDLQNAGAARASGYNAWANAFNGGANNLSQLMYMRQFLQPTDTSTWNPGAIGS
jgi:hypothetical protein